MPIVGCFEKNEEIYYTVAERDSPVEEIKAKHLMATRPLLIELFDYQNNVDMEKRIITTIDTNEAFPLRMINVIIDYLEAEHYEVGLQLIENLYCTGKKPPFPLLVSVVNIILKSKKKIKKRQLLRQHWLLCKRAHSVLIDILHLFGPGIYNQLWNEFKYFELVAAKDENNDDYEILNTKQLAEYRDFWQYTDALLNTEAKDIDSKCRRLVLDLFVNILKYDLKSRMNSETKLADSIFVRTLHKDAICRISKFDKYLKVILKSFPGEDENEFHLMGDIFNMMITISCYDNIASIDDLVKQTYEIFRDMDTSKCQEFMQIIQYPTFLISLLDRTLADANTSMVPVEYQHYRTTKHILLDLRKMFYYVFKALPTSTNSLKAIYHHVTIVSKYCLCVFSTFNISRQKKNKIILPEEQLELLITSQFSIVREWESLIESLLSQFTEAENLDFIENIRWAMKLTILTITEYF